jgi:hypothetical protein
MQDPSPEDGLTWSRCPEIQSDLMQEIQSGCGDANSPANLCNLPMTGLKNLCTLASGFVATQRTSLNRVFSAGPLPARHAF